MNRIVDNDVDQFPSQESKDWFDWLEETLIEADHWLSDPINVHDAVAAVENVLITKHHDYGETNLEAFGELGILVRASDKVARLKNLIDKDAEVDNESREDTWRDLAGYAIQALILIKRTKCSRKANAFEIRKNRLIRGICPDCGAGVLLRPDFWSDALRCSSGCGFALQDIYRMHGQYPEFSAMIDFLASQPAITGQM